MICYICYTQGSSEQLRKFDCQVVYTATGIARILLKPKEEEMSEVSSLLEPSVSNRCSEGRLEGFNESLIIERACDEIMRQFIQGVEFNQVTIETVND